MRVFYGALALVFLSFCLFISQLSAQDLDEVTIAGKITDSNNSPIVGATVLATEVTTRAERTVVTDDEGRYKFIELKPGTYRVKASAAGFGAKERADIVTISGQNLQLDLRLDPAGVQAEATVVVSEQDAPVVDTTRTIVGGTITQREVEELPNDSRNPLDLVLTLGGTAEEQLSTRDLSSDRGTRSQSPPGTTPEEAGIFGLSGGAAYSNNITIDGLDNNDDRSASFRFQPSIEAVAEVQVITNQFSAEYGRASGGRVNIRTRAGGNKFRGRAFYFFRDDVFNANTWNNNRNNIDRPPLREHNPGFTFGGPVVKDRLFFFTSYEYDDLADTTVLDAWVPVSGGNPRFPLPAPTDTTRQVTVPSSAGFPAIVVSPYIVPADTPFTNHIFTARGDWNINDAQSVTVGYQLGRSNDLRAFSGTNRIADSLIGRVRDTDAINFTHNYVISSKLVNQARVQYSRLNPSSVQAAGAASAAVLVSFPLVTDGGTQVFGSTTNSSDRKENRWQAQDTVSYVTGEQTWRFGFDFQNVDTTFIDRFDVTGTYSFSGNSGFVFFAANNPSSFAQNFNTNSEVQNKYIGFFVQDDFRLRPNLTLGLGLRYERETVIDDTDNWGPRIGVAWNPFPKSSKTVVRFGAGIFYNRVLLRTIDDYTGDSQTLRFNTASDATINQPAGVPINFTTIRTFLASQFPNGLTLDTVVPINDLGNSYTVRQLSLPSNIFRSLSPDIQIPQSYQANVGFEREIADGLVFETNVTLNRTVRLWRETNPNAPVLPAGLSDVSGDGRVTLTDYLLGINTGTNRFFLGSNTETTGTHAGSQTGGTCSASTTLCFVNLNTPTTSEPNGGCASATPNTAYCRALAALDPLRPLFAQFGETQLEQVTSIGNSRYIGAIFELRKRYKKLGAGFGGSWRFAYTLSRLMDDGIVNTSDPTTPGDFRGDWSRSLADRTHRVSMTATIDTPWWLGKLRFSPLFRYGSSSPFNLSAGGLDRNLDDLSNDRPNFTGDLDDIRWRIFSSSPFPGASAQQLSLAPLGSPGTLPRNAGHGPSLWQFNINVTREWKITERVRLRPSIEITNPLNMNIFSFGSNFINLENLAACTGTAPLTTTQQETCNGFLAPTRTMTHRRMRLGLRFDF
jgi:hypothetical protein